MSISLSPETSRLIEARMKCGGYGTPDDVVLAALASLEQSERAGDFEAGELDGLLAVADAEIEKGDVLDGEEVFRELRQLGANRRNQAE